MVKEDIEKIIERYLHGFLDKNALGRPEDVLKKPIVKIFGKEVEAVDLTQPFSASTPACN